MIKRALTILGVCAMTFSLLAAQCAATTKKGTQCKRQASANSQFCWQHGGSTKAQQAGGTTDAPAAAATRTAPQVSTRCQATTKSGTPCTRPAKAGSKFCWQHGADMPGESGGAPVGAPVKAQETTARERTSGDGVCTGMTKDGRRCTRKAKPGTDRCWQHAR